MATATVPEVVQSRVEWTALVCLVLVVCPGCAMGGMRVNDSAPETALGAPPVGALAVAEAKAREVFGPRDSKYDVVLRQLDLGGLRRPLRNHWAFLAEGLFKLPPARCVVVVSRSLDTYSMPDDFAQVMAGEGLSGGTPEDFPAVVHLFARLVAQGQVVSDVQDIPWDGDVGKDPSTYAAEIVPPGFEASSDPPRGEFCTWVPVGGVLTKWTVRFPSGGEFVVEEERRLGVRIGKFEVLQ